jgi:hypothetical protein
MSHICNKYMSKRISNYAIDNNLELSSIEKELLFCIHSYKNNKTGWCIPKISTIASKMGLSVRRVGQLITVLRDKGFIVTVKRSNKNGHRSSNQYFFPFDKNYLDYLDIQDIKKEQLIASKKQLQKQGSVGFSCKSQKETLLPSNNLKESSVNNIFKNSFIDKKEDEVKKDRKSNSSNIFEMEELQTNKNNKQNKNKFTLEENTSFVSEYSSEIKNKYGSDIDESKLNFCLMLFTKHKNNLNKRFSLDIWVKRLYRWVENAIKSIKDKIIANKSKELNQLEQYNQAKQQQYLANLEKIKQENNDIKFKLLDDNIDNYEAVEIIANMSIKHDKEEIIKSEILRKYDNNILEAYRNIDIDNPDNFITKDRLSISIKDTNNKALSIISTTKYLINNIKSYLNDHYANIHSVFIQSTNINSYGQQNNQFRHIITL